jgi:hypothetical protein
MACAEQTRPLVTRLPAPLAASPTVDGQLADRLWVRELRAGPKIVSYPDAFGALWSASLGAHPTLDARQGAEMNPLNLIRFAPA